MNPARSSLPGKYRIITSLLGVAVIAFLAWYLYQNRTVFGALRNVTWQQVAWLILLDAAGFLLNSMMDRSMINRLEPAVTFADCYLLQYANNFLNRILPTIGGGAVFRAVYLKRKYKFPYASFMSTLAGLYVVSFLTVSLVGITCLVIIGASYQLFSGVVMAVFILIAACCLFVIIVSPRFPESRHWWIKVLGSVVEGWRLIKSDAKFVVLYVLFSLLILAISSLQALISYRALGFNAEPLPMLYLSTLGIIIAFLNFAPDGIGVREGVYALSAGVVKMPPDVLVLGSLVLRAISISTSLVVGAISYFILMRQLRRLPEEEREPAA